MCSNIHSNLLAPIYCRIEIGGKFMNNVAEDFKTFAMRIKEQPNSEPYDLCVNLYEHAEEVVLANGVGGFEREFSLLKEIINTTPPVPLDLSVGIDEKHAWYEMMSRALNKGVVEELSEEQKSSLLSLVGTYDDGVDIWIANNIDDLSVNQINQIYLAQTIGFYYYFSNLSEFEPESLDGVLSHLLNA